MLSNKSAKYLSVKTEPFLAFVKAILEDPSINGDIDTVEAEIHLAGLKMTHWVRWSESKKKFKHEGIDGEIEWLTVDEFLKLYPSNITWHIIK